MASKTYCRCGNMASVPPGAVFNETCPLCGLPYSLREWLKHNRRPGAQVWGAAPRTFETKEQRT